MLVNRASLKFLAASLQKIGFSPSAVSVTASSPLAEEMGKSPSWILAIPKSRKSYRLAESWKRVFTKQRQMRKSPFRQIGRLASKRFIDTPGLQIRAVGACPTISLKRVAEWRLATIEWWWSCTDFSVIGLSGNDNLWKRTSTGLKRCSQTT